MTTRKHWLERVFHAFLFELLALIICVPLLVWGLGLEVVHAGALTLIISLVAMVWNMIFNAIFDYFERRYHWQRTTKIRLLHGISFEAGLILAVVPLIAWWADISLLEAFVLDIGLLMFFLPYTIIYNWAYDRLRAAFYQQNAAM
ncbi:multidrug/biocide efflux PACE transporter [Solimicrobium silvestre]|uniref:Putative membrane protein n=1 Tax=Solimicrobium silvestre TaxID=2099400 RepID=A0A2S9GX57_9BURK|nr:multidrug/biocide efflux PACE transporter [Solimicrobium silvestre]PRC92299.1 putative membrane protein [Solimicrobium silvestre]